MSDDKPGLFIALFVGLKLSMYWSRSLGTVHDIDAGHVEKDY
jgi:hypothetical protein